MRIRNICLAIAGVIACAALAVLTMVVIVMGAWVVGMIATPVSAGPLPFEPYLYFVDVGLGVGLGVATILGGRLLDTWRACQ